MRRLENLLVPVDFSTFSRCALAFASQLATDDRNGEDAPRLQLAHAIEAMPGYVRKVLFPYAALGEDDRVFEAEIVEAARTELDEYFEVNDELRRRFISDPIIEFGISKQCISRWAGVITADMIVIGAFGEHGVNSCGPGSTSARVVAGATQPVALVRDYDPGVTVSRILVAVDLSKDSSSILEFAIGLAVDLDAEVVVDHVIASPYVDDTNWLVEREMEVGAGALDNRLRPRIEGLLEELIEQLEYPFSRKEEAVELVDEHLIGFGDPAEEICSAAYEGGFDLIVIGRGRRRQTNHGGVGRVAAAVMTEAPTHVVVVPAASKSTTLT